LLLVTIPLQRRAFAALLVALTVGLSVAVVSPGMAGATSQGSRWVGRCGFTQSPYGRLGVYIEKGSVSCREGRHLIHREFHASGESVGTGDVRYADGWVCGGQMGSYFCAKPLWHPPGHPKRYVAALACHMGSGSSEVRCPGRIERRIP
jgi:hypothetical protein